MKVWTLLKVWTPLNKSDCLELPERIEPFQREAFEAFFSRMIEAHRHEDALLNGRLQGFVVATAILMAAVAQFREARFASIAAVLCVSGLILSNGALHVLTRTARTIEWYLDALVRLEQLLLPPQQQLFASRRRSLSELEDKPAYLPVSFILGTGVPMFVGLVWVVLLVALGFIHHIWPLVWPPWPVIG